MSLRKVFSSGADAAFRAAGDVPVRAVYIARRPETYDSATDMTSVVVTRYSVSVILMKSHRNEDRRTGQEPAYQTAILLAREIPIVPSLEDGLLIDGQSYIVNAIDTDPANTVWELELLRP